MKIIEAMKRVKVNKQKIADLQDRIGKVCANLSFETPQYPNTRAQVDEWLQSALDTSRDNVQLLAAISRTNLATTVSVTLGGETVTKSIAEWVWRRREYAALDLRTYQMLTDRNLKEGNMPNSTGGEPTKVTIERHYDPQRRDRMTAMFREEPHEIDAALEVVNAVTDLLE